MSRHSFPGYATYTKGSLYPAPVGLDKIVGSYCYAGFVLYVASVAEVVGVAGVPGVSTVVR